MKNPSHTSAKTTRRIGRLWSGAAHVRTTSRERHVRAASRTGCGGRGVADRLTGTGPFEPRDTVGGARRTGRGAVTPQNAVTAAGTSGQKNPTAAAAFLGNKYRPTAAATAQCRDDGRRLRLLRLLLRFGISDRVLARRRRRLEGVPGRRDGRRRYDGLLLRGGRTTDRRRRRTRRANRPLRCRPGYTW